MAQQIVIIPGKTLRFNLAITSSFNADFDKYLCRKQGKLKVCNPLVIYWFKNLTAHINMEIIKKDIIPLNHRKIVEENERYVEIYKITCLVNNKMYVGQAVSHILNNGKYRRYGMERRLNGHISEAFSIKKNQCHYLNNSIRKHGRDQFVVELLELCQINESDEIESFYIKKLGTMFPDGYNLKFGTITTRLSEEGKKRVSNGVYEYYKDKKFSRFEDVEFPESEDIHNFIKPLSRRKKQYGWYVYYKNKKADFGGVHIPLDVSKQRAEEFIKEVKKQYIAKHLVAGNSSES